MASFGLRSLTCLLVLCAPACVIRLTERNAPEPNGAVSGGPVDCSSMQVTPRGGTQGPAPALKFLGRFDLRGLNPENPNQSNVRFDWSGNQIVARFEGSQVSVRIEAEQSDVFFSATLDGGPPIEVQVNANKGFVAPAGPPQAYLLFENIPPGPHEVVLHRDTEAQSGVTIFHGFDFGGGKLLPPIPKTRRIELIGDSITCGYGIEGQNATCPFDIEIRRSGDCSNIENKDCQIVRAPVTENNYLAYGSAVARLFDADASTLCWSGKGVQRNYREPTAAGLDAKTTIPTYWRDRTIGSLVNAPAMLPPDADPANFGIPWDWNEPEPQVVLINLGTNDFTRDVLFNNEGFRPGDKGVGDNVPDGDIDRAAFQQEFARFIGDVRAKRPNAHIFIAVPPMITDQFPLDNARKDLTAIIRAIAADFEGRGDKKVYAMELVEQGTRYGLGCDYHPNLVVHQIMTEQVAGAIRSKTCWD
jgi:lysophospholipase L1-like esterase